MGKSQRVVSVILAAILIVSTLGAIWLIFAQTQEQDELNRAINELQQNQQDNAQTPEEGKLEGTKLTGFVPTNARITSLTTETIVQGDGARVEPNSTITAHYTGALATDGTIFQSSKDTGQPFTAPLTNLIQGWQQGLVGQQAGTTVRLFIPAELAYGQSGQGNIPPDSDLIFDIEIITVE